MGKLIFHIDANSAYLSWEAAYRLQHGEKLDLREIPAVVGGDEESRHGIVLTKSIPAKKFDIHTGETLYNARAKCPGIVIVPPRYWLYMKCSAAVNYPRLKSKA
jgi:DNA polymerase-4